VDVPVGTPVDSDTVRQLLRRDTAPIFPQAAILARSAALGYGTAGHGTNLHTHAGFIEGDYPRYPLVI